MTDGVGRPILGFLTGCKSIFLLFSAFFWLFVPKTSNAFRKSFVSMDVEDGGGRESSLETARQRDSETERQPEDCLRSSRLNCSYSLRFLVRLLRKECHEPCDRKKQFPAIA